MDDSAAGRWMAVAGRWLAKLQGDALVAQLQGDGWLSSREMVG
jgi:hypothetical protein